MNATWRFRLLAWLILVFVGCVSVSNLVAEFLRPSLPLLPTTGKPVLPDQLSAARLASAIAPFRSDLRGDYAVALASQAFNSESAAASRGEEANRAAQEAVRRALEIGPHDSRLWLVLAWLEARGNRAESLAAESLKMSYLTGPNRADLIPARLESATSANYLTDPDLRDLAGADVRAILTQLPEQRSTLLNEYARASNTGKHFLEDSAMTIDPKFADALRGKK